LDDNNNRNTHGAIRAVDAKLEQAQQQLEALVLSHQEEKRKMEEVTQKMKELDEKIETLPHLEAKIVKFLMQCGQPVAARQIQQACSSDGEKYSSKDINSTLYKSTHLKDIVKCIQRGEPGKVAPLWTLQQ
jgi:phage-related minor tail protein